MRKARAQESCTILRPSVASVKFYVDTPADSTAAAHAHNPETIVLASISDGDRRHNGEDGCREGCTSHREGKVLNGWTRCGTE